MTVSSSRRTSPFRGTPASNHRDARSRAGSPPSPSRGRVARRTLPSASTAPARTVLPAERPTRASAPSCRRPYCRASCRHQNRRRTRRHHTRRRSRPSHHVRAWMHPNPALQFARIVVSPAVRDVCDDTILVMPDGDPADGMGATLPGGAAPPTNASPLAITAAASATASVAPSGAPSVTPGLAPSVTASVDIGSSDTLLPADAAAHGATLPGPHVVADLPALPRVDDSLYAIGEEIARGGMGKILSARDRRLRRDVVIKVTRHESRAHRSAVRARGADHRAPAASVDRARLRRRRARRWPRVLRDGARARPVARGGDRGDARRCAIDSRCCRTRSRCPMRSRTRTARA